MRLLTKIAAMASLAGVVGVALTACGGDTSANKNTKPIVLRRTT